MQGVPLQTVVRLLRHRQVSMTLCYPQVPDRDAEDTAKSIGETFSAIME